MNDRNIWDDPSILVKRDLYGMTPEDVHGQFTANTLYHQERMFRRIMGIFKFKGFPEWWNLDYFKKWLLLYGYICVADFPSYGVLPMICTLNGYNIWRQPSNCLIQNRYITGEHNFTIGKDCVLIKLQHNYQGVSPLLAYYSQRYASIDANIDVNLINSRPAWMFETENKAQEETAKKIYEEITEGRPAVFTRGNKSNPLNTQEGFKLNQLDVKKTFIAPELYDTRRCTDYCFYNDIGLNNVNIDKKERVNTKEVESNVYELRNAVDDWKEHLEEGCKQVNDMFGLRLEVEFPYYPEVKEGDMFGSMEYAGRSGMEQ